MQQNSKPNKPNWSRFSIRSLFFSSRGPNSVNSQTKVSNKNSKTITYEIPSSSFTVYLNQKNERKQNDFECSDFNEIDVSQNGSKLSVFTIKKMNKVSVSDNDNDNDNDNDHVFCNICFDVVDTNRIHKLMNCCHSICYSCLQMYLQIEISESRVILNCPMCLESIHPNEIRTILNDETLISKYEDFMIRKVLALEPDTRWCPSPDCGYAVIASGCAGCPKLRCQRPGCNTYFCYHCKSEWHPTQTCDAARTQRLASLRTSSISPDCIQNFKQCPMCQVLIVKMDDGSCNHMVCALCGAEFCWLCMKVVGDLHYLSPSGCTFWGKKTWSKKKKIMWQLGTLIGAPIGIILVAGIAVPALIIGIPVWVARKIYHRYRTTNKRKRNMAIFGGTLASAIMSPILAGLAVSVGVPILLFYVYGIVPISLCRTGECDRKKLSKMHVGKDDGVEVRNGDDEDDIKTVNDDVSVRVIINPSIGEESMISGSHILRIESDIDKGSISNKALAGSIISNTFINLPTIPHMDDQEEFFKTNITAENTIENQETLSDNLSAVLGLSVQMVQDETTSIKKSNEVTVIHEEDRENDITNEPKSKKNHSTFRNLRKLFFHSKSKSKLDDHKKDKLPISNDFAI